MKQKVLNYIKKHNLLSKDKAIVIALSGGVDSMVLFDILRSLNYKVIIAHVNHNVRKESYYEYQEIEKLAKNLDIPFYGLILEEINNANFHDEARKKRYDFFKEVANENNTNTICTAHHLDDLIETSLMKIVRGSNIFGYSGIKNKVSIDGIDIVRPLLCLNKDEIYEYANNNKLLYFEDQSNKTDHYTRNRYRHHIIPLLKEENPNIYQEFQSFSNQLLNAFNYIRKQSSSILNNWNNEININEYKKLDKALQYDIISILLEKYKIIQITSKIETIMEIINKDKANSSIDLNYQYVFYKSYAKGFISKKINPTPYEIIINDFGLYSLPNGDSILYTKILQKNNTNYINICYNNKMSLPIIVRNRKDGDVIHFDYGNKKVKDHLIDKKIPLIDRDIIPIVTDSNDNIIGIIGIGPKKGQGDAYLYWLRSNEYEK